LTGSALVSIFQWEASDAPIFQLSETFVLAESPHANTVKPAKTVSTLAEALFAYPLPS
jgi:hypothetical protein